MDQPTNWEQTVRLEVFKALTGGLYYSPGIGTDGDKGSAIVDDLIKETLRISKAILEGQEQLVLRTPATGRN